VSPTRDDTAALARHLRALERRARLARVLRAAAVGLGSGALTFVVVTALLPPTAPPTWSALGWVAVVLAALQGGGWAARRDPSAPSRGPLAAALLRRVDPTLGAEARSAVELAEDPVARSLAPALVDAHRRRVLSRLADAPPARVLPWRDVLGNGALRLGLLLAAAAAAALALLGETALPGRFPMLHPGVEAGRGRVGAVVSGFAVELRFPDHLERSPETLTDPAVIVAPRGTTAAVDLTLAIPATGAELLLGDVPVALRVTPDGHTARGTFVLRRDASLSVRVARDDGRLVTDAATRRVEVVQDGAPEVVLLHPTRDILAEAAEEVVVAWRVADDVGVAEVVLVVHGSPGADSPKRRRLERWEPGATLREVRGSTTVTAAELGAGEGETLEIWLEAADGDRVTGPHVGESAHVRLIVAAPSDLRREDLAALEGLLGRALDALADRLEDPVPGPAAAAKTRFERVDGSTGAFLTALAEAAADGDEPLPGVDEVEEAAGEIRRAQRRETRLHRGGDLGALDARREVDETIVTGLEDAALALADALGTARLGDVAAMARELDALRREMSSLLAELARGEGGPEARAALERALAQAEARIRQIAARLGAMGEQVPRDFLNRDSLPAGETSDALGDLRDALARNDLDAAAEHLAELERRIDTLAGGLSGAQQAYAEARAGPRARARSELLDRLAGLEEEQRDLAGRSGEVGREAGDRALEAARSSAGPEGLDGLAERADQLAERLGGLADDGPRPRRRGGRGNLAPFDEELRQSAEARLADARDALRAGDLGEARAMMREAARASGDLARDLELGARMFPGANGDDAAVAEDARDIARETAALGQDVDGAIPRLDRYVPQEQRQALRQDATRQREAREALEGLAGDPGQGGRPSPEGGPGGDGAPAPSPLSPEDRRALAEAERAMQQAEGALREGRPVEAHGEQQRALERLGDVRRRLLDEAQGGGDGDRSRGGRGGGGEGMGRWARSREPVDIPRGDDFIGPTERRRQVVEAMREAPPEGFRDAVERYYEELLR